MLSTEQAFELLSDVRRANSMYSEGTLWMNSNVAFLLSPPREMEIIDEYFGQSSSLLNRGKQLFSHFASYKDPRTFVPLSTSEAFALIEKKEMANAMYANGTLVMNSNVALVVREGNDERAAAKGVPRQSEVSASKPKEVSASKPKEVSASEVVATSARTLPLVPRVENERNCGDAADNECANGLNCAREEEPWVLVE